MKMLPVIKILKYKCSAASRHLRHRRRTGSVQFVGSQIGPGSFSLRSKRSRASERNAGYAKAKSKKVKGRGWGRGKKGTLARKPLVFEKRPLVFTVEFIY